MRTIIAATAASDERARYRFYAGTSLMPPPQDRGRLARIPACLRFGQENAGQDARDPRAG